jgi:hypothetical protein
MMTHGARQRTNEKRDRMMLSKLRSELTSIVGNAKHLQAVLIDGDDYGLRIGDRRVARSTVLGWARRDLIKQVSARPRSILYRVTNPGEAT